MPNGPVNNAVAPNEGGNNLYIIVVDNSSGQPISQGVCITGTYNTQCCNCWPSGCSGCNGCTSGSGSSVSIYTDKNGLAQWSIPFTCQGGYSLLFQTPNYQDELLQFSTGAITGPVNVQVGMSTGTAFQLAQEPPQCLGMWADMNQASQLTTQGVSKTGASVTNALSGLGLYAVIGIALIAVILIVLAATGVLSRGRSSAPALPQGPRVGP